MAALRMWKSFGQTKYCLMSSVRGRHSLRCGQLVKPSLSFGGRLQAAQRTYNSSSKETSQSEEDPRNKPIKFSTSRARHMTLSQTLGINVEIEKNPSKKSLYAGFILMAIMTYIIFFLPEDEDELDLLELEIEKEGAK